MQQVPTPDPRETYPVPGTQRLVFLKNVVRNPRIEVGEFTYYDASGSPAERAEDFETNNVLYHFDFIGDRLVIGAFCAVASRARFIMNGANHALGGLSTYPFEIFPGWGLPPRPQERPRDTVVGSDVWIGYDALVLPGRSIGHGAVVGAGSVVTRDVPPYCVVGGNPARVIRERYDPETVRRLLAVAWWDWSAQKIARNARLIAGADVEALESAD